MRVTTIHPAARRELEEAFGFYEDQRQGLGQDFMAQIEDALSFISTYPEGSPLLRDPARRCLVLRFPYSIIYRIRRDRIRILAVSHQSRRPFYWLSRMR